MVTAGSLFGGEVSKYVWLKICESQYQLQCLRGIFVCLLYVCATVLGERIGR